MSTTSSRAQLYDFKIRQSRTERDRCAQELIRVQQAITELNRYIELQTDATKVVPVPQIEVLRLQSAWLEHQHQQQQLLKSQLHDLRLRESDCIESVRVAHLNVYRWEQLEKQRLSQERIQEARAERRIGNIGRPRYDVYGEFED